MSEHGIADTPTSVRIERRLPGPIERVWSYIVDGEKRALWFAGGDFEPKVGGAANFIFDHGKLSDEPTPEAWKAFEGQTASGEVTRYEPNRVFAYKGDWGGETEVIFELTPAGDDVILAIRQTRLEDAGKKAAYGSGWHAYLDTLEDRLRNVKPRGFWTNFEKRQAEYAERFPG
jgi:uncharacterized protein YndB with AHSA1/START domain